MPPETYTEQALKAIQRADDWQSVGIGGIVALLLLREVFAFVLKMRNGKEKKNGNGDENGLAIIRGLMQGNAEHLKEIVRSLAQLTEHFRQDVHEREVNYPPKLFEESIQLARSTNRIAGDNKACIERVDRRVGRIDLSVRRLVRDADQSEDDES